MKKTIILVIAAALLASCSPSPKSTVDSMRVKACSGDIQGFFAYIDKTQVAESLKGELTGAGDQPADGWDRIGKAIGEAVAGAIVPGMAELIWTKYEDEIKKGKSGSLCNIQIVKEEKLDKIAKVTVVFPSGKQQTWVLAKYDKWLVTAINNK
jgi:hypothetical protein